MPVSFQRYLGTFRPSASLVALWPSFTSRQPADSPLPLAHLLAGDPFAASCGPLITCQGPLPWPWSLCSPAGAKGPQSADPSAAAGRAVNQPSNSVNRPRGEGEGVDSSCSCSCSCSCSDLPLMLMLHAKCHSKIAVIDTRLPSPLIGRERKFLIQWIWRFFQPAARQFKEAAPDPPPNSHLAPHVSPYQFTRRVQPMSLWCCYQKPPGSAEAARNGKSI